LFLCSNKMNHVSCFVDFLKYGPSGTFMLAGFIAGSVFTFYMMSRDGAFENIRPSAIKENKSIDPNSTAEIQLSIKFLNMFMAAAMVYALFQLYLGGRFETQIYSVLCYIIMTYFFGFGGVVFVCRNLDSKDTDFFPDTLGSKDADIFPELSFETSLSGTHTEIQLWQAKYGHYYNEKGRTLELSPSAISKRIANPMYNFVTRQKDSITEIDRELMFTDLLLVASREENGVSSGGKRWNLVHHEPQGDISVETVVVTGTKWNCYRVSGMIEATPMQVASLVLNDDRIGEYDEMFDRIELLEVVDEKSRVRHSFYKPVWPTTARDFVIMTTWEPLEDGRVLVATRSVHHPLVPAEKNFVRARVLIAGYVFTPAESQEGNLITFCDVIIHTDVQCEWIPPALLNPFSNTKPVGYFRNMQQICKKEFSPTPLQR